MWATETIEGSNAMDSMDPLVLQAYKRPYDPTWLLGYVRAILRAWHQVSHVMLMVESLGSGAFQLAVRRSASAAAVADVLARRCKLPMGAFRMQFRGKFVHGTAPFQGALRDEVMRMVVRSPLLGGVKVREGYLIKQPLHGGMLSSAKERFFVLTDDAIEWFEDERSLQAPKGRLPLHGAYIERRAAELCVVSGSERLVMRGDDLDRWEAALRSSLDAPSMMERLAIAEGRVEAAEVRAAAAEVQVRKLEVELAAARARAEAVEAQVASSLPPPNTIAAGSAASSTHANVSTPAAVTPTHIPIAHPSPMSTDCMALPPPEAPPSKEPLLRLHLIVGEGYMARKQRQRATEAHELHLKGTTVEELRAQKFKVEELLAAGLEMRQLLVAGYAVADLRTSKLTAQDLLSLGLDLPQLLIAGYGVVELREAGCPPEQLVDLGLSADALAAGLEARVMWARELIALSVPAGQLRSAGYDPRTLTRAGLSLATLLEAGFDDAGELKAASVTAGELHLAGFGAAELKQAGFELDDLRHAGLGVEELQQTGEFTEEELLRFTDPLRCVMGGRCSYAEMCNWRGPVAPPCDRCGRPITMQ
mmetsp:Transcript_14338/g.37200  ORF Transcript_14338/g.37200 Transcript_14338/m.37200 type:complete len:591 (+) Transcript_14338:36-1808(+)